MEMSQEKMNCERAMRVTKVFSLCLIILFASSATLTSAAAQQQEKRVALVIGNGAYAKGPLATTANDAGLIAQNLQAAYSNPRTQ